MTVRQPIPSSPAQATADASGNATFTFQAIDGSWTWAGTLNVAVAPDTATFQATTGGSILFEWNGANAFGPVVVTGPAQMVVTASGLIPGSNYLMTWLGEATAEDPNPEWIWPQPNSSSVTSSTETGTARLAADTAPAPPSSSSSGPDLSPPSPLRSRSTPRSSSG